jgi:hypothetical protein
MDKSTRPPRPVERVPAALVLDTELTRSDTQVLIHLEMKAGRSRLAKITVAGLADALGVYPSTVRRALDKGLKRGHVTSVEPDERGRLYVTLRPLPPKGVSWVEAPRWFVCDPDRPFWQKHALLAILASYTASDRSINHASLYGSKYAGIISRCHVRHYTPGNRPLPGGKCSQPGKDWVQAREMVEGLLVDLQKIGLLERCGVADMGQPASYRIDRAVLRRCEGADPAECEGADPAECEGADQLTVLPLPETLAADAASVGLATDVTSHARRAKHVVRRSGLRPLQGLATDVASPGLAADAASPGWDSPVEWDDDIAADKTLLAVWEYDTTDGADAYGVSPERCASTPFGGLDDSPEREAEVAVTSRNGSTPTPATDETAVPPTPATRKSGRAAKPWLYNPEDMKAWLRNPGYQ